MSVFKCKMCGGTIEFEEGASVGTCSYCGTKQTLPRLDDDRRTNLYDRANHLRRNNEFDKAAGIYEQILNDDAGDAEAYWSLVLCRYGIEYVEDPATHKRLPTVNRAQYTSIFADEDYKSALANADVSQKELYETEAKQIDEIQKGILAISQKEEPFDVFICYKETDQNGRRTPDSVLATDLYHQLVREGFKVFFARITLEDKLGSAYEPYIFAALNSAKVMVVLGTKPEYFNAVWVKNEWSRFLLLVKQSGGRKTLIPAYRDMDPYDLPEEFSHLQAQDMSKLGFMQDLIRGIKKLAGGEPAAAAAPKAQPTVIQTENASVTALIDRGLLALEDGEWAQADGFFEQSLNFDAKNARAYLGKLMAQKHVRKQEQLRDCAEPFDDSPNYHKAQRFADEKLKKELENANAFIKERNENARCEGIYQKAVSAMNAATNESAFLAAAGIFDTIPQYKDAAALSEKCREDATESAYRDALRFMDNASNEKTYTAAADMFKALGDYKDAAEKVTRCKEKAEACRKDLIYFEAKRFTNEKTIFGYEDALQKFKQIPGWKDADDQAEYCVRCIEEYNAKKEADRLEREHQAEQKRIAAEKAAKKRKKIAAIVIPIIILVIVFLTLFANGVFDAGSKGLKFSGGTVTGIGSCSDTEIVIPKQHGFDKVTSIGNHAFYYCTSLTSVTIPDSVTSIGDEVFYNCKSLTSVTIPDSVTKIGDQAFYNCTSLTSVTIPDSVTEIGGWAFSDCDSLTSVTIDNSVTEIGGWAFSGCSSLKTVYYRGSSSQWAKISIGNNNDPLKNATIVYNYTGG